MSLFQIADATAADLLTVCDLLGREVRLPEAVDERLWMVRDEQGQAAATLRLHMNIGAIQPRYWYHVGCAVHAAAELKLHHRQSTLLLCNDLTGATALADLAGSDEALATGLRQAQGLGAALIVELPGVRDAQRHSPFWHGLGRHFYAGDPARALAEHGPAWRDLVAALLPQQVLYAAFLPEQAQAAVGGCREEALPLRQLLTRLGWAYRQHVSVDEAGAVMEWGR